ncbi:MAG: hypothetical protein HDR19_03685 [Lachnospiraceae bacterium]|nr:hypothetical protein [Lachnospiraceae bacterium]
MKNKFFTNELVRFANIGLALAYIKKLALFAVKNLQTLVRMGDYYETVGSYEYAAFTQAYCACDH